jgi:hypothetical protein
MRIIATYHLKNPGGRDIFTGSQELKRYIDAHPEKVLFAYAHLEVNRWLQRVEPEESDKYVAMAARNLVNCIAFASPPNKVRPRRRG